MQGSFHRQVRQLPRRKPTLSAGTWRAYREGPPPCKCTPNTDACLLHLAWRLEGPSCTASTYTNPIRCTSSRCVHDGVARGGLCGPLPQRRGRLLVNGEGARLQPAWVVAVLPASSRQRQQRCVHPPPCMFTDLLAVSVYVPRAGTKQTGRHSTLKTCGTDPSPLPPLMTMQRSGAMSACALTRRVRACLIGRGVEAGGGDQGALTDSLCFKILALALQQPATPLPRAPALTHSRAAVCMCGQVSRGIAPLLLIGWHSSALTVLATHGMHITRRLLSQSMCGQHVVQRDHAAPQATLPTPSNAAASSY